MPVMTCDLNDPMGHFFDNFFDRGLKKSWSLSMSDGVPWRRDLGTAVPNDDALYEVVVRRRREMKRQNEA